MDRHEIQASALDLETPGRRDYHVLVEHPTLWGHFRIPVTVLVGSEASTGRGILSIGGTHGDEYEGPLAIKNLMHELSLDRVSGRMIFVPVLNVAAFRQGLRDTPQDQLNLNRAFPGSERASLTYRIAAFVDRHLFPAVHVVLDIHSGGQVARFPPLAEFHAVSDPGLRKEFEATARGFGTRFVQIYQNETPGLLTSRAEDLGKITIGTELGWGRAVSARGVWHARRGILRAGVRHGQLLCQDEKEDTGPPLEQILVDASAFECSLRSPFTGHFEPVVDVGEKVRAGQLLGLQHNFEEIDRRPQSLRAPHDGFVISLACLGSVFPGQIVAQVALETEWTLESSS